MRLGGACEKKVLRRDLDDPPHSRPVSPEIASMLDAPVNTVYSWIARGKKTLKEALS